MAMLTKKLNKNKEEQKADTFEKYVKKLRSKTTFNGLEIERFSWYRKVLGLL